MFAIPVSAEREKDHNMREGPATLESLGVALKDLTDTDFKAISSLLLEDVDQIAAMHKGKRREDDPVPDGEVAWEMFSYDLKLLISQQDHTVALSTVTWQETDSDLIKELAQVDRVIPEDRMYGDRLERGGIAQPLPDRSPVQSELGNDIDPSDTPVGTAGPSTLPRSGETPPLFLSQMTSYRSAEDMADDVDSSDHPLSSLRSAKQDPNKCIACMDSVGTAGLQFPCKHFYHIECATQLFEQSIKDESFWPPRCCKQPVSTEMVTRTLSKSSTAIFLEKFRERSTENPLYCPDANCSSFVGQASSLEERTRVVCPKCGIAICTACKKTDHPLEDICSTDIEAQQVLALAQNKGWKRCPGCRRMVELSHGCYHMTCVCGTQFCYVCRALWKNCACRQWDEARLVITNENAVENQVTHTRRQRTLRRQ